MSYAFGREQRRIQTKSPPNKDEAGDGLRVERDRGRGFRYSLNGKTYVLDANNGTNTLHGGYPGWNTVVWSVSTSVLQPRGLAAAEPRLPGRQGLPPVTGPGCTAFRAPVTATVTYSLTNDNQLKIGYRAKNQLTTDATVIDLTNHTYLNLARGAPASRVIAMLSPAP